MKKKLKPINKCKTVAELLASPKRWIKNGFFKNMGGFDCEMNSAVKFCLSGAIQKIVYCNMVNKSENELRRKLNEVIGEYKTIVDFNDDPKTIYEDIIRAVKLAKI